MHNGPAIVRGAVGETGGRTWARTKDPLIKSQLLYQLSYASDVDFDMAGSGVPGWWRAVSRACPTCQEGF